MRGQRWGPSGAAGSRRIERVVNVKYCAAAQLCARRFRTRGYPNKPLECQVTCRRFLRVLLADFTELLRGQRALVDLCTQKELQHKSGETEGENLPG